MFNFANAAPFEPYVYGSERPGYRERPVEKTHIKEWVSYMRQNGIQRVCCLLDNQQVSIYPVNLLEEYRQTFGAQNVCHAPIPDYSLCPSELLTGLILPFLSHAVASNQKVVVHCAGGIGRTGHILAAWLVHHHSISPLEAIETIGKTQLANRNPVEAVEAGVATYKELISLLDSCQVKA